MEFVTLATFLAPQAMFFVFNATQLLFQGLFFGLCFAARDSTFTFALLISVFVKLTLVAGIKIEGHVN